jgi:hypothetical protein
MLRAMRRLVALASLTIFPAVVFPAVIFPATAAAQMAQGPPTPLVTDLSKVAVGSWSTYTTTLAETKMATKVALVKRAASGSTLEMSIEGGMVAKAGNVVTQMILAPGENASVQRMIVQVGANDPMEMPLQGGSTQGFVKPDPKTLVKEETVKVAAGSFKTKHYRITSAPGDTADFWVSDKVAPIGVVKMEMTQKSNPAIPAQFKMELTGVGKGAKTIITKPAKPFDQSALMKESMAGAGAPPAGP